MVAGHGLWGALQQCGGQAGVKESVVLAMYTFRVGPWLPNRPLSFPQV